MSVEKQLKFSRNTILIPTLFVFTIWFIYWLEINFGWNFNKFGVFPRTFKQVEDVDLS